MIHWMIKKKKRNNSLKRTCFESFGSLESTRKSETTNSNNNDDDDIDGASN